MYKHEVKVTIFSDFEDRNYDRMTKELSYRNKIYFVHVRKI